MSPDEILERILTWAGQRDDIRAALLVGSRARTDRPADAWSDLDLVLVTTHPERYVADGAWVAELGTPWLTFVEETAVGNERERRVLYEDAVDVDFAILPRDTVARLVARGIPEEIQSVIRRGARVLIDRDGLAARLVAAVGPAPPRRPPSEAAFLELVNDFLYHAVWVAKKIRRGELWTAAWCCDGMKSQLHRMIEWHAQAIHGVDTWHRGRFLEQWADPRALEGLRSAFAHYDDADLRRALLAMMDLFHWLAREVAGNFGFTDPTEADARVTAWVRECLAEG